ncbi:hypothetical protein SLEP1_g55738 [Rubroshorea leprosula]|uniref:Uncharacterized protein n=1 Tax=Rubroshorea leprosula TaxID=152421 RepID=A0AAV5MHB0_9ROSI|nr:hypothetical protein SLEP1_g55738 [Rubroshorea leprosula]
MILLDFSYCFHALKPLVIALFWLPFCYYNFCLNVAQF